MRAGHFDKASNMNYTLAFSLRAERFLKELEEVIRARKAARDVGAGGSRGRAMPRLSASARSF